MSQISKLNLNLLSKNETDLIFHDLKSLITVDYPDTEIKKETRISFASTIISRILMASTLDLDKLMGLRKSFIDSCFSLKISLNQNINTLENNPAIPAEIKAQCINDLVSRIGNIDKYLTYAFDDYEKKPEKETVDKEKGIRWEVLDEIREDINKAEKDSRRRASKVFYLLERALAEAPDKANIWIRTTEFCIRHAPSHITDIFNRLDNISGKDLLPLGVAFLKRQLLSLCTTRFIRAVWHLYAFPKGSVDFDSTGYEFISTFISDLKKADDNYYFFDGTNKLYELAKAFYNLLINGEADNFDGLINSDLKGESSFLLIYLINLADCLDSSKKVADAIDLLLLRVNPSEGYTAALIINVIDTASIPNIIELKNLKHIVDSINSQEIKDAYTLATYKHNEPDHEQISIRELLQSKSWKESRFSSSEYVAVKILCDVVSHITNTKSITQRLRSVSFNISSIFINKDEIKNLRWTSLLSESYTIHVSFSDENANQILQRLYKAPSLLAESEYEHARVFELGVIFYNLLCGEPVDDWQKLFKENGYNWKSKINRLADSGRISTASKRILQGCLLPYVWESFRINGSISKRNHDLAVKNLMVLEKRLNSLKRSLKDNIVLRSVETGHILNGKPDDNNDGFKVTEFKIIETN